MVPIMSLWLPILLSAALVFVMSSIIHMMLGYHAADYRKVPSEDEFMDAVRKFNLPAGDYMFPCPSDPKAMSDPAFVAKMKKGPKGMMTIFSTGQNFMGMQLVQWFVYCVIVSVIAAYVAGRALGPGAEYLRVFRFVGVTAFACYAMALWQNSIWYKRSIGTTLRSNFDGLLYALLTAGSFGWLWPK